MEEFWNQGDLEKIQGLPKTTFMDRDNCDVCKSQIGYIDFIAMPLFEVLRVEFPTFDKICQNLRENKTKWLEMLQNRS